MTIRSLALSGVIALFLVAACTPTPTIAPSTSPSVAPSASTQPSADVSPSVEPSASATTEPSASAEPSASVEPSVEPSSSVEPSPSASVEPSASPVALSFEGQGTATTDTFTLPAATYQVVLKATLVNAATCSIDVTLVPETGTPIKVGSVTAATGEATVKVDVPAGTYVARIHDPSCKWVVDITTQ